MKIYKLFSIVLLTVFGCKSLDLANTTNRKITIYMIGDSTMANKKNPKENPEFGWGQVLPNYFNNQVLIKNKAVNGRSTRSFILENRWDSIYNQLDKGDYVFIQFGHNDAKETDPLRYTNPQTSYRYNLIKFIKETRTKGAKPILFTPIARRKFNEEGVLLDSHGNYSLTVRLISQEFNVPLIDMQYLTELLEERYGKEGSKKLHLHFEKNENTFFPEGKKDDTHLSVLGANEVAKLAIEELKLNVKSLKKYISK
jgi:lysophospholipase L1-like esterase